MTTWATEQEIQERFHRETLPDQYGVYYHPGGCPNCGDAPCYLLCSNHPGHYSVGQERADSEYHDSLSHDQWFAMAVAQYERAHGEPYVS